MKFRGGSKREKIAPQMAPMIDVVFQLLIFFMLTLKIIRPEGEFAVNMPLASDQQESTDDPLLNDIRVRLLAGEGGTLAALELNGTRPPAGEDPFAWLNGRILQILGDPTDDAAREDVSVEIDPDYGLDYRYFVQAIGAVSGSVDEQGNVVPYVESIKFAPVREP